MSTDPYADINPDYASLETATDSERMRPRFEEELQRVWGEEIRLREFYVTRVIPRAEGSFAIQYLTAVKTPQYPDERRIFFFGRLLGMSESWPDYANRDNPNVFVLSDLRLVVLVFPFDPELENLPRFQEPDQALRMIERLRPHLGPDANEVECVEHEILGYRLERRCVLRYTLSHRRRNDGTSQQLHFIAKIFRPKDLEKAARISALLNEKGFKRGSQDGLTVPYVYYEDHSTSALIMEAAPGMTLHSLSGNRAFAEACLEAGRLLRKLHSVHLEGLPDYTAADELTIFRNRFNAAISVYPRLGDYIARSFGRLTQSQDALPGDCMRVCSHRDYYDKQVLYSPERTTLVDSGDMTITDAALDYSNFMVHLFLRSLQAPDQRYRIEDGMKGFASGYDNSDEGFRLRARWWSAATLIRLAVLYSLRPRWRGLVLPLLEKANEELRQSKT